MAVAKKKVTHQWAYDVYEILGRSDAGWLKVKLVKTVKVRRAKEASAREFVEHKFSYQVTGKQHIIERNR